MLMRINELISLYTKERSKRNVEIRILFLPTTFNHVGSLFLPGEAGAYESLRITEL